jgi:hypothetical protein
MGLVPDHGHADADDPWATVFDAIEGVAGFR